MRIIIEETPGKLEELEENLELISENQTTLQKAQGETEGNQGWKKSRKIMKSKQNGEGKSQKFMGN